MKKIISIIIILVLVVSSCKNKIFAQSSHYYVTEIRGMCRDSVMTKNDICIIIKSYGFAEIKNSIETSEIRNELLFKCLNDNPSYFLAMYNNQSCKNRKRINKDLISPINDSINIKEIILNLKKIDNGTLKTNKLIKILQQADSTSF